MTNQRFRIGGAIAAVMCVIIALLTLPVAGRAAGAWDCADEPTGGATPTALGSPIPAGGQTPFPEEGGALTIFAAASLTDAFTEIGARLEAAHPNLSFTFNFAGSQTLVTQAAAGAPADILALAAESHMVAAEEADLLARDPVVFARNALTIIVPEANPAGIEAPSDLANDGVKLLLASPDVPAGAYARVSLCAMADDVATYGEDFIDRVAANVVSEEDQVRAVLAKVALNEADAGIVYTSDLMTAVADGVESIPIPAEVNVVASYPIAPTSDGDAELTAAFIAFVLSEEGQAVLDEFGFLPAVDT